MWELEGSSFSRPITIFCPGHACHCDRWAWITWTLLVESRFKRPKFFDPFSSFELFQDFQSLYDSTSGII